MSFRVINGEMRQVLAKMEPESVDAVVCDPPYELGFMGKAWDRSGVAFDPATWAACLCVLKPGGHLVAFGGTRTFHRMTCAIEDAGFEVRDCLSWLYGSGFPKSHNLCGEWEGWGTALKPAWEPIILARKPLSGTVAATVLEHGTGALNVDGCRIGESKRIPGGRPSRNEGRQVFGKYAAMDGSESGYNPNIGRWPANVVLDEEAAVQLDEQSGELVSGKAIGGLHRRSDKFGNCYGAYKGARTEGDVMYGDTGGASRFFYTAKASAAERSGASGGRNPHPTVKPLALMRWLCRLVTPPGGLILDPFCGSGTTGHAALLEGFRVVLVEKDEAMASFARLRIAGPMFAEER